MGVLVVGQGRASATNRMLVADAPPPPWSGRSGVLRCPAMPALSDRFERAFVLASTLHRDQRRKGTEIPYLSHLMAVSALVLEHGGGEDDAIAALLHDAAEDQGGLATLERIRSAFGGRVADLVAAVSDTFATEKPPWRERKLAYLAHLATADEAAIRLSLADKLHNATCTLADVHRLGATAWERFKGGRDGTLWYLRGVADAARARAVHPGLLRRLDAVIAELGQTG